MFKPSIAKLSIGSLDRTSLSVEATYNPKELAYQRTVPWAPHALANKQDEDQMEVEFTGAQPRTMELELLFDGFEAGETVQAQIDVLDELAAVDAELKRPHFCIATWGDQGVRALRCVIESIAVRYTMFDRTGTPLRAVCNVKVREAHLQGEYEAGERRQMAAMRQRMAARDR